MNTWTAFLIASTAVDGLAFGAVLIRQARRARKSGRNPYIHLPHLLAAAIVGGLLFTAKLPLHLMLGVRAFGLANLAWQACAVLLPLFGLAVVTVTLVQRWRRGARFFSGPVVAVAVMALLTLPLTAWARFGEPHRLVLEQATVPILAADPAERPIRVAVAADIQTDRITDYERQAMDRLMALQPDVILLPGDFFQGTLAEYERELPAWRDLLGRLRAPGGVFAVQGNIDSRRRMTQMLEGTAVRWLDNEVVTTDVRGRRLAVGGIDYWYDRPPACRAVEQLRQVPNCDARILIAHTPDAALPLSADMGIDLVVAGHTHGGQVQIPGLGPLVTASRVPRATAAGGLTQVNGVYTYVSRGVGHERGTSPRIRLFCPPEISLLTLVSR